VADEDESVKLPLECCVANGVLTITVNAATVKWATEHHEAFYNPDAETENGEESYTVKVKDAKVWLEEVAMQITDEREDGSSLLSDLFDKAIENAAEQGSEGLADEDD
jgi:hypothetical protein